jgi:fatty acid desaturase
MPRPLACQSSPDASAGADRATHSCLGAQAPSTRLDPALLADIRRALRDFETPSDAHGLLLLAADWLGLAFGFSLWFTLPLAPNLPVRILLYIAAVLIIAGRMRGLESCVHEASHFLLFRTRPWNTRLQCLFAWPILDRVQSYRIEHLVHHRDLGRDGDPARQLYEELGVTQFPRRFWWAMFIRPLLGHSTLWFLRDRLSYLRLDRRYVRDMAIAWLPVLIVVTLADAWLWFGLFYLVPLLLVYPALIVASEVFDHLGLFHRDCPVRGTRNNLGPGQGLLVHAHDDGYHVVHHLNARIPCHRLREAHARLKQLPGFRQLCVESQSCLETLRQVYQPTDAETAPEPAFAETDDATAHRGP